MLSAVRSTVLSFFAPAVPVAPEPGPPKPITARHVRQSLIGRGSIDKGHRAGVRRIVVTVEDDLFERIRARAVGRRVPLAAAIRQLLVCGLDAGGER